MQELRRLHILVMFDQQLLLIHNLREAYMHANQLSDNPNTSQS